MNLFNSFFSDGSKTTTRTTTTINILLIVSLKTTTNAQHIIQKTNKINEHLIDESSELIKRYLRQFKLRHLKFIETQNLCNRTQRTHLLISLYWQILIEFLLIRFTHFKQIDFNKRKKNSTNRAIICVHQLLTRQRFTRDILHRIYICNYEINKRVADV